MKISRLFFFRSAFLLAMMLLCFNILITRGNMGLTRIDHGYKPPVNRDVYVAINGKDSNKGTLDDPVNTIQKGLELVSPGFTVFVRAGTYKEKLNFPITGQKDKVITLKPYGAEKVIVSGEGLAVSGSEALVTVSAVSFIVIERLDICNFKSLAPSVNVDGITIKAGSSHITLRKNRIYNIENNASAEMGRSGHGIHVIGNTDVVMRNILVEENEIFDCNTGYSENLTINGYVDGFEVRRNKVYNGENIGIVAAGGYAANLNPAHNYVRNGIIADNEVFNLDGRTGPIPAFKNHNGAIGIYVDGARNIIVERNLVKDCGRGIGIVSETNNFPTRECTVRNNLVYNCSLAGIYLGGYVGYTGGGTYNCSVVNNSIYCNNKDLGYANEVEGELRLTEHCYNNVMKNNVIYARPKGLFIHKYSLTGSGNTIDHNVYYTTGQPQWIWNSTNDSPVDFKAWKKISGQDANSILKIVSPKFNPNVNRKWKRFQQ